MKRIIAVAVLALAGCAAPVEKKGTVLQVEWCQPVMHVDQDGNRYLLYTSPQGNIVAVVTKDGGCAVGGTGKHVELALEAVAEKLRDGKE